MIRTELAGKRFGYLVVQTLAEISRNGHARWHVICDCGVSKTVLGTHLVSNKTRSCGKCIVLRERRNFGGIGDLPLTYFSSLKRGANGEKGRKPIEFDISIEYLWETFKQQNGKCKYSNLPIDFRSKTASCDRIDSSLGYIEGNVQWLHKDVNMMKRHYSEKYFFEICNKITNTTKTDNVN